MRRINHLRSLDTHNVFLLKIEKINASAAANTHCHFYTLVFILAFYYYEKSGKDLYGQY